MRYRTDSLPALNEQLGEVKIKNPIEQHMFGQAGLFRQENTEKRRHMSVREWAELCSRDDLRAPGVDDTGLHARATNGSARTRTRSRRKTRCAETAEPEMTPDVKVKDEQDDDETLDDHLTRQLTEEVGKSLSDSHQQSITPDADQDPTTLSDRHPSVDGDASDEVKPRTKSGRRAGQTKEARAAALAQRVEKDKAFLENFDPHSDWLPPNTTQFDYTPEWCKELERRYWRNCGLGQPAWYGADMAGSLFTDETAAWNVAHLPSTLDRLLPSSSKSLPGVNTPYLYFGMWRATFAWHVEDMDLFSINYIHFGAPKFWYAMPQARATALERVMRGISSMAFPSLNRLGANLPVCNIQVTSPRIHHSVPSSYGTSHSLHRRNFYHNHPADRTRWFSRLVNLLSLTRGDITQGLTWVSTVRRALILHWTVGLS